MRVVRDISIGAFIGLVGIYAHWPLAITLVLSASTGILLGYLDNKEKKQ